MCAACVSCRAEEGGQEADQVVLNVQWERERTPAASGDVHQYPTYHVIGMLVRTFGYMVPCDG
eukprot:16400-Eustigmatos_ZCMA.PRE.1